MQTYRMTSVRPTFMTIVTLRDILIEKILYNEIRVKHQSASGVAIGGQGATPPNPGKIWIVGNGGPINGCLIRSHKVHRL